MKNFTNDWFKITGIKNFEKYAPKEGNFLEIGCYEGQASLWLMENTKAMLTVIDTFAGGQDLPAEVNLLERFKDNTYEYNDRISIEIGRSQQRLIRLDDYFDFIYIDGSHLASDTLEDAVLSFRLLKKGGIMIFDDYTWGRQLPLDQIPAVGIDAFVMAYVNKLEVLEKNSQLILRKL
jgi:predicted O-methyltransferase YrrM